MHRKAANKQILKVGIVIIVVIILVTILFSISPRESAVAGQAVGGQVTGGACPDSAYPLGPIITPLELAEGTPGTLYPAVCCSRQASACTRQDSSGNYCFNNGEFATPHQINDRRELCLNNKWLVCRSVQRDGAAAVADNGIIKGDFICVSQQMGGTGLGNIPSGTWVSTATGCRSSNAGESYNNVAYCDGTRWVGPPQCTRTTSTSSLPDGSVTNTVSAQACCQTGQCALQNSCHREGNRPVDTNPSLQANLVCKRDGNWDECNSALPQSRGAISSNGRYVCSQNNQWIPITQGCSAATAGQSYGNAYCDGTTNRWTSCSGTNVYCPNTQATRTEPTSICNSAVANIVIGTVIGEPTAGTHYCSFVNGQGSWIRCDQTTAGLGVSNAQPNTPYAFNYVCGGIGGTTNLAWQPINCPASVCGRGVSSAQCVGSNQVDVVTRTSTVGTTSYLNSPTQLVGCAPNNGCYYDSDRDPATSPNSFAFDERDQTGSYVCANANTWLTCRTGTAPVPSDGGRWLCSGNWLECTLNGGTQTSRAVGTQIGNFVCTQTSPGVFQWFSSFTCTYNDKYRLVNGNTRICDGQNYVSCPIPQNSPLVIDPNVRVQCVANNVITVTELACNNIAANNLPIDDDNDGSANCADQQCSQLQTVAINDNNAYSVNLKYNDCYNVTIFRNPNPPVISSYYGDMRLCDVGMRGSTIGVADRATLCYRTNLVGNQVGDFVVESLTSIASDSLRTMDVNTNPNIPVSLLQNPPELTFVYGRPTAGVKEVDVVLTKDISVNQVGLPVGTLAQNMLAGQSLVLLLDNEYYLVSYPSTELVFSTDKLMISHLPTDTNVPVRPYSGVNSYIFNVGARSIVVTSDTANIIFSSIRPGEVPAGRVTERNISLDYEVQFTQQTPIKVKHQSSGVENRFTICRQDVSADIDQALFCVDDVLTFALKRNNLTYYNPTGTGADDYVLLYDFNSTNKVISIIELENLDINTPTSANPRNVIYANYINNLVSGRRLAVRYANKLYLVSHPIQPTFSQTVTKLTSFIEGVTTDFSALGSEGLVDYNILDGKITIKRRYGQAPPLPFQMSVLSSRQILNQPINLLQELSASMTSELPISVSGPINYGIINKSVNDRIQLQAQFRLHQDVPLPAGQDFTLSFNTPTIQTGAVRTIGSNQVLLHYNNAQSIGSGTSARLVKSVALYLLYDITGAGGTTTSHAFDSTFLSSFTAGKEIAIKYSNVYYLLSYQGATANTAQFFTLDRLVLSTLDKSRTFQPSVSGLAATFTVPEGQLRVDLLLDPNPATANDVIRFSGGVSALTPRLFGVNEYMVPLTSTGLVGIGDPTAGLAFVTLDLCQENRYVGQTAARICTTTIRGVGAPVTSDFEVNQPTLFAFDVDNNPATDNTEHFILEINGLTDASKQVFIRRVINLDIARPPFLGIVASYGIIDWNLFARNVSVGFGPVFNISGMMYSPEAQSQDILSFAFRDYPSASVRYPIRQQNQMTPILYNVSYTLSEDLVVIKQGEDRSRGIRATVTDALVILEPYKYLKDDKSILLLNATVNDRIEYFVTDLPSPLYSLDLSRRPTTSRANVIRLRLADENENTRTYINRYFAAGDSQDVRLGTGFVTISVPVIVYNNAGNFVHAHVTMKRK